MEMEGLKTANYPLFVDKGGPQKWISDGGAGCPCGWIKKIPQCECY